MISELLSMNNKLLLSSTFSLQYKGIDVLFYELRKKIHLCVCKILRLYLEKVPFINRICVLLCGFILELRR